MRPRTNSLLPFRVVTMIVWLISFCGGVFGQTSAARPDRGFMPGASYSVSDIESINLTNGNLHLSIPLASLPPIAGGKLSFTLNAVYDSKLWNITRQENQLTPFENCSSWVVDTPQLSDQAGWRIRGGYSIVFRNAHEDFDYVVPQPPGPASCENDVLENVQLQYPWYRAILIGPDGAEHELRPTDSYPTYAGSREYLKNYYRDKPDTTGVPMRYYSIDGSYLSVVINPPGYATQWTIYLNDGTRVVQSNSGIQRITDTNGNSIKIFTDTNGHHYQDEQTGREIRVTPDNQVWYQTVGGAWLSIDITWDTTWVKGKIYRVNAWQDSGGETGGGSECWHDEVLTTDLQVLREIVFPVTEPGQPARRYSFSYNSDETTTTTDQIRWDCSLAPEAYTREVSKGMGGLSQMVTPSGATVNYSYSKDSVHSFSVFGDSNGIPRETITQKRVTHDGVTDTWNYSVDEYGGVGGTVTGPEGSVTSEKCYAHDPGFGQFFGSGEMSGLVYRSYRSGKEIVERHWILMPFSGANTGGTGNFYPATFNPVVDAEYTSIADTNGNIARMSAKTYTYDYNGNVLQTTDYDWFDPALVSRDAQGVPTGVPGSATVLRVVNNSYYNPATSSSSGNVYAKRSLSTGTPLILSALQQTTLGPGITQLSYDGQAYGVTPTVGNLTSQSVWDDLDSKWITSSQTYNAYGNLITKTDPRGKVTQFYYDDATHAAPNRVVVDPQNGTGTQTTTTAFDYYTGLVTSQTDANNNVSTIDYTNQLLGSFDPFGRPGVTIGPLAGGVNQHQKVTTTYIDHARQVVVAADLNAENDRLLKTRTTVDMLGRVVFSEQTEDGTNYSIAAQKAYDVAGRTTYTSNPMRTTAASTDGWTRTTVDELGRVTAIATFSGASQPTLSATNWTGRIISTYDANKTTVTDQAGKARRSEVDGVGRLINVVEDPGGLAYQTNYTYDVFGNLRTVGQGVQTRTFTYDSLSRLRTAANPESGTTTYTYDDNGNLLTKQDARPVTTTFAYDSLNRPTTKTYSDSTPRVDWFYDTQTLPTGAPSFDRGFAKGRLVGVTYGGGSAGTYRGYDARGAILRQYQQTDAVNYLVEATYFLNGSRQSEVYPAVPGAGDRRTVNYANDTAGRLASLTSAATTYAPAASVSSISYSAPGGLSSETYGNNLIHAVTYNSRMQADQIKLGTSGSPTSVVSIAYNYGATNNNGNVQSITYNGGGLSYTQTFGYDTLNRLTTSQENSGSSWSQTNGYDRYGNRWVDLGGGNQSLYINTTDNRITGWSYDNAGNLLNDGNRSYSYDGENKVSKVDNVAAYVYDGEGQRVRKLLGENLRVVYGIGGQQIAEFDGSNGSLKKEYIFGGATIVTIDPTAISANGTRYTTSDHLGSPRVVTNSSAAVISRHDYEPFGEEIGSGVGGRTLGDGFGVTDGIRQKFTQKERDIETGLDYFLARYYSSTQGRFTSPDEFKGGPDELYVLGTGDEEKQALPYALITNPQSINKYSYAYNNPLRWVDPDGHQGEPKKGLVDRLLQYLGQIWKGENPQDGMMQGSGDGEIQKRDQVGPIDSDSNRLAINGLRERGKVAQAYAETIATVDPTGISDFSLGWMNGDTTRVLTAMAGAVLHIGGASVTMREAKSLVGSWAAGSFETVSKSIKWHFAEHGAEVGAKDVVQYMRKASAFASNLRGAQRVPLGNGMSRYVKKGYYVIKDSAGKIISYGLEN